MESFNAILERATVRHGGTEFLRKLPQPKSTEALVRTPADRYLAAMAKVVFRAGFVWRVVASRWPGFEEAFSGFHPGKVASLDSSQLEALAQDPNIIRNRTKIRSVRQNARFLIETATEHGSFGRFLADWPSNDTVGLWLHLKQHGNRLGGNSGPMFLREVGKDTFVLSNDVVAYLVDQDVVGKRPTGKADLRRVQSAFNGWAEESGRPLCQVSRIVAMSFGEVFEGRGSS